MKLKEIANLLNTTEWLAAGKARSGLFGYASKTGHYSRERIEDYQQYGTQWSNNLQPRYAPETIDLEVPGWENPPVGTMRKYRVGHGDEGDNPDKDLCWLAHYYFIPNHFYFPDRQKLAPIGKPLVNLRKRFFTYAQECNIGVYPDPKSQLALISVLGKKNGDKDYLMLGLDVINPLLNWLTQQTVQALPIVQQHWIGIPSGTLHYQKLVEPARCELSSQDFLEHKPLIHAQSLYRRALNCNDPIYSFFSFWRAAEAVDDAKALWCRSTRYSIWKITEEKLPEHKVFGRRVGKKFTKFMDDSRDAYRNAIAHVATYKDEGKVLTGGNAEDEAILQVNIACIRYVAKVKIDNFHATLERTI